MTEASKAKQRGHTHTHTLMADNPKATPDICFLIGNEVSPSNTGHVHVSNRGITRHVRAWQTYDTHQTHEITES